MKTIKQFTLIALLAASFALPALTSSRAADLTPVVMRLYWPKETPPSILPAAEGTWEPPGIVTVQ